MEKETKMIGMLFGARILIETDSEDVARECQRWFETMDRRYRAAGEEKLMTDMAKLKMFINVRDIFRALNNYLYLAEDKKMFDMGAELIDPKNYKNPSLL